MPEKVGKTENNMSPTSQVNDIQNPNGNIAKEQIKNALKKK
mgnify:CR=1 FL=1